MTVYSRFLERGYFPKELPPAFTTASFASYATTKAGRAALSSYTPSNKCTSCVEYRLALASPGGLTHRVLQIPHPHGYSVLADLVADNFSRLLSKAGSSRFSRSRPVYAEGQPRAIRPSVKPGNLARERAVSRGGATHLLKVDVSQFYPSLYTHAIGWAISPTARLRKNWASKKLLGSRLDQALMNAQAKLSHGVPIGTDISFLLAEIVLAQVDKTASLPLERSFRWYDDYEVACGSRTEAEAALSKLTRALASYRLRPNPLKTAIYDLPRTAGDTWQNDLIALAKRTLNSPNSMAAYFDHAFRTRQSHPEQAVLMYAMGTLFQLRKPTSASLRVAEHCISQALLAEPGCAQKAFALLTYWDLNGATFDRALFGRTFDRLLALHDSRGITSDIAWTLAFAIQHKLTLSKSVGRRLSILEDDAVTIQALHAHSLGLLPGFTSGRILTALKATSCDGEHWLAMYESVRQGFLPALGQMVQSNSLMASMLGRKVSFYRLGSAPYAILIHQGSAPGWVVADWARTASRPVRKKRPLPPIQKLLAADLHSSDAAVRKIARQFLETLVYGTGGQEGESAESYE